MTTKRSVRFSAAAVICRPGEDSERGVVLVLVAASLVVLLLIAALVLDVGYAYAVGRQEQTVADLSAMAAARQVPSDPIGACDSGWAYAKANLSSIPNSASMPCSTFPSSCDDTTAAAEYTATSTGAYTITFYYPVPDSVLLTMSSQPVIQPADGSDPCGRFGVTISHNDASFFSGISGIGNLNPHVKAVARTSSGNCGAESCAVANLVSLDPTGCVGIEANGASNTQTTTEVVVDSYIPAPGKPATPGAIAVDSDGTTCSGGKTTIDAAGAAQIQAEPTTGLETGQISLFAQAGDQTTCSKPACTPAQIPSNIAPQPISSASRVTRAPADYAYNCKSSYPNYDGVVPIVGCDTTEPKSGGPYIDEFTAAIQTDLTNNTPPDSTWQTFPTCKPKSNGVYVGNWWVNCPSGQGFQPGGAQITFEGNVIFNGNVNQSGGELDFEGQPVVCPPPGTTIGSCSDGSVPSSCEPPSLNGPLTVNGIPGASAASCLDYSVYNPSSSAPALFTDSNGNTQYSCTLGTSSSAGIFTPYSPAPDCASFVYVNGSMTPSSSFTLNFNGAFVYVAASSPGTNNATTNIQASSNYGCAKQTGANSLTSNSTGSTGNWIAPTDGLFDNLALWSESGSGTNSSGGSSTASFGLHGGGNTSVDGVFFTPCAQFSISGGFTNPQTAQFLTFQLSVGGGSVLTMVPVPNRQLQTNSPHSMLIR